MTASWQESYDKPRQCVKKQRHHFANKVPYCQGYGLSSSHVQMWELDHKEGRVPKNWCLQTVVLEKTLEIPLDRKEIKPDTLKGNQPWIFIGSTDVKAETPIIWLPDGNTQLIAKDLYAGKDWRQKEKRAKEDAMIGWYHWLNGHEFEWTLGDGVGQGSLTCWSPGVTKGQTQLGDWTTTNIFCKTYLIISI